MSGNAADFAISLSATYEEEIEPLLAAATQKFALEALSRVVMRSPVDTGRFRGNWTVSIGEPDLSADAMIDPSGAETIAAGEARITAMQGARIVYVQNNLPYGPRLENGWSKQAPAGMVAVTFAELTSLFVA